MSGSTTAMLDLDQIQVEEGFNPRQQFDRQQMDELVASVRQSGIATALTVRPNGGSHYVLVAGQRRLIAAREAGLKQVPVLIREDEGALVAAIAENLIRADLNPVEEAKALKRLAELEGLATHKKIAERVGKSAGFVSERLRLLELPDGCHAAIAAGAVPVEAERNLRRVAKVAPRVAECACELAQREEIDGRDIVNAFDDVLLFVSRAQVRNAPTMVDPGRVRLCEVVDQGKLVELLEAFRKARPYIQTDDVVLSLSEAEIDAARAAGQLIEHEVDHGEWSSVARFITDRALAGDLAERMIERVAKEAAERQARGAEASGGSGQAELTPEAEKAARAEQREEAKRVKAAAERFNEAVGRNLMDRRGAAGRKEHGLNRVKALAAILLADHDGLAARGLRLVLPQLCEVEQKTLKSGEPREKRTYADREAANEYIWSKVEEARSADQAIEVLSEALIAAALADEAAVPQSGRVHWYSPGRERAEKLLAAEIKAARPRRTRASR